MHAEKIDLTKEGEVTSTIENGVLRICFSHPKSNSLPGALLRQLAEVIDTAATDKRVQVVSIESAGEKAFCAGASFDEFLAVSNLEEAQSFFSGFAFVIDALRRCPKLTVGRVQGKAVGGGVGIIAACDYVVASSAASVKLSEIALGIGPFIIGPAVERKVGKSAFAAMAIDADWRDADWCLANGLYSQVVPSTDELNTAVSELLSKLSSYSEQATKRLKSVLWEGTADWKALLFGRVNITASLVLTEHAQKTVAGFKAQSK